MAERKRPRGFQIFQDRHGRWRCYHRKTREPIDLEKFPLYSLEFYGECYRISELLDARNAKPGTLGMLIERYRASDAFQELIAPRTRADYQRCFDYLQNIADTPLARFTPPLIVRIRDKAVQSKGRRQGNYVKSVLSVVFGWGKERGYVKENPAAGIKGVRKPKGAPDANRPWTDAEREAVLAALPAHMRLPVMLMMYYAFDPQDALQLPRTAVSNGRIEMRRSKTDQPVYVPLLPIVEREIEAHLDHEAKTLCANSYGRSWTGSGFRSSWEPIRKKLESSGEVQPGLTMKGLRHTVATILREMGKDYSTIQLVLGQKTEAMARHYSKRADMTKQTAAAVTDFEAEVTKRKTPVVKPK